MKMKLLSAILFLIAINLFSQSNNAVFLESKDYFTIPKDQRLSKPLLREWYFYKQRAFPLSEIPSNALNKAIEQENEIIFKNNNHSLMQAQQPEWKPIGPYSIGGRIKSVVHHPNKDGFVYIGAAAGGIWKTTDYGANWTPIFDYENAISFGSVAIDPNNPEILYAGTGEPSRNVDAYSGTGLYKSYDDGNSWKLIGLTFVGSFSKVYVHPLNSNLVVAGGVKRGHGFYKSIDGGATWEKKFDGDVTDLTINPNNENEFFIGVMGAGIYFTSDGGATWIQKNAGLNSGIGRISVQFAPSNTDVLYALMEISEEISGEGRIYKSTDHGNSWYLKYKGKDAFFNGQGWYDNFIMVHPTNENICFAGGINLYKTNDGGVSWNFSSNGVHVDQHHGCFNPNNPNQIYLGNDGGMYRSNDGGSTWTAINNNLQVTQFYDMSIDNSKINYNFGGTQDNGTLGSYQNGNWGSVFSGDGFHTVVDYDDPNQIYGEVLQIISGNTRIIPWKKNLGNGRYSYLTNGIDINEESIWNPPLVIDPNYSNILYHGRKKIFSTYDNGDTWVALSKQYEGFFSSIAISPLNSEVIYAGCSNGILIVTTNGGQNWEEVHTNGLIQRYITDIECSPHKEGTAFVTYSGYSTPHIFKTTDFGKSWTNISKTLPDIPCNAIIVHPENEQYLFVGTDIGVFASFDGGNEWLPFGTKLPRSPVIDLEFHKNRVILPELTLRAATHGRSIWEVVVPNEPTTEPYITAPAGGEVYTVGTRQTLAWTGFRLPVSVEFSYDNGYNWVTIANNLNSSFLQWTIPNHTTIYGLIKVRSEIDQTSRISNTFSIMPKTEGSILSVSSVTHVAYGLAYDRKGGIWTTSFYGNKVYKLNSETLIKEKDFTVPGDSLFTDLTIDREKGILYIHQLNSTSGDKGGKILVLDTNGTKIKELNSPATNYPIGLELVDGKLLVGDRDGKRKLYMINPETGNVEAEASNPFQEYAGPRGLCYDGSDYIYQVCTAFPGNTLTSAWIIKIHKSNLELALDSIALESMEGLINARGIDLDPDDKNFWITDFNGNIYKIAGFETITDINEQIIDEKNRIICSIFPNPITDISRCAFKSQIDGNLLVVITDVLGNQVQKLFDDNIVNNSHYSFTINAQNFSNGLYNISFILDKRKILDKRIIIVK